MKRALISTVLLASLSFAAHAQGAKPGDPKEGEKKAAMCIGCHGIKGYQASFPEVHKVPMISGQGGKYIAAALNAYKKGERKHPTMRGIAVSLTDQDIADLSAFYEQHGARALDLPYFQPGIGSASRRVRGMLLLVLHADPAFTPEHPDRLAGGPLRTFMEAYLESSEGVQPNDWDAKALFKAIDREGGVPMRRKGTER